MCKAYVRFPPGSTGKPYNQVSNNIPMGDGGMGTQEGKVLSSTVVAVHILTLGNWVIG